MAVETPIQLYRHLLKCLKKLPNESQGYYKHYIRQGFRSHADEKDSERIMQIISRALEDAEWIMRKRIEVRSESRDQHEGLPDCLAQPDPPAEQVMFESVLPTRQVLFVTLTCTNAQMMGTNAKGSLDSGIPSVCRRQRQAV